MVQSVRGLQPAARPPRRVWTRLDTATGEAQMWSPGARCFCEELMFQPGAAGAEVEDDGFLLGMYFDAGQQRSCLVVRRRRCARPHVVLVGGVGDPRRRCCCYYRNSSPSVLLCMYLVIMSGQLDPTCPCQADAPAWVVSGSIAKAARMPGRNPCPLRTVQVLDAADFSKGPITRIWLRHHVPHGLHGFYTEQYFGPQRQ